MGQFPPDENHPRYQEWLNASIRHIAARKKLDCMSHVPEDDPEFVAAHAEWLASKREYEKLVEQVMKQTP